MMRFQFRKLLSGLRSSQHGNAVLMTALGLPVLLAATGYGVDTAQWYMWKRELQHSVDQGAIGGAWALAYSSTSDYNTRAKQEYYGNQDLIKGFASAPTVLLTNWDGGSNNSVKVTGTASRRLPFSGMLFNSSAVISASAQAAFAPGASYNACLITLKKDGTTFTVGGNATVIADCGFGALSCDNDAITIDGSSTVQTKSITTCGTADVPTSLQGTVNEGVHGMTDAYKNTYVPTPKAPDDKTQNPKCNGNGKKAIAVLSPGIYNGGYTANCTTQFKPGVYFINGGVLDLSTNAEVTGNNVMFVLQNGATIKLGGQGGAGSLTLSPLGDQAATVNGGAYASHADEISQMLVMQDSSNTSVVDSKINGNSEVNVSGTMYMPKTNLTINGTSGTKSNLCFQISAYTLKISGNSYLQTLCDANSTTSLGSTVAGVRLIG